MIDTLENLEKQSNHANDLTIKEIVRIIVLKPTTEIYILLAQTKYKYYYVFPTL